jgi:hypothetical protein
VRQLQLLVVGTLFAASAVSCAGREPLGQKIFSPGPAPYQRQKAQRFDPYNEVQVGPRDDTSRPPDYLEPNPEPSRGRWLEWGLPRFGHP